VRLFVCAAVCLCGCLSVRLFVCAAVCLCGCFLAEDKGFEPSTGFPAPDFESGS
jgi:hypothetical protein